jgi:hypothetical protein
VRVNVYAEEITDRVEIVEKDGFTGLRLYTELPVTIRDSLGTTQVRGPFEHHPGDDDSAAVTFWGKQALIPVLEKSLDLLRQHYRDRAAAADMMNEGYMKAGG